MRTDNETLLLFIYKNAEMGKSSLPYICDKSDDKRFSRVLSELLKEYAEIYSKAELMLIDCGENDPRGLSASERFMSDASVRMNAMLDKRISNYAEMLIKGAAMGVTDISEQLSKYKNASDDTKALAERLKRCNESVIERMTDFLTVS